MRAQENQDEHCYTSFTPRRLLDYQFLEIASNGQKSPALEASLDYNKPYAAFHNSAAKYTESPLDISRARRQGPDGLQVGKIPFF
jgi:hypothetical protein